VTWSARSIWGLEGKGRAFVPSLFMDVALTGTVNSRHGSSRQWVTVGDLYSKKPASDGEHQCLEERVTVENVVNFKGFLLKSQVGI
jgi:hypothetical protein